MSRIQVKRSNNNDDDPSLGKMRSSTTQHQNIQLGTNLSPENRGNADSSVSSLNDTGGLSNASGGRGSRSIQIQKSAPLTPASAETGALRKKRRKAAAPTSMAFRVQPKGHHDQDLKREVVSFFPIHAEDLEPFLRAVVRRVGYKPLDEQTVVKHVLVRADLLCQFARVHDVRPAIWIPLENTVFCL